jgi:hypothetical protein
VLHPEELDSFVRDGFVRVDRAVPKAVVADCAATVMDVLQSQGLDGTDPSTWTQPVVRPACIASPAFAAAASQPILAEAYDQLIGAGTWTRHQSAGGSIVVRFPHPADPGDAGWHIDGSYEVGNEYWVNVRSRDRGLLCLFLFSDVGPDDAPTELKVGSHLDVPPLLLPFGVRGAPFWRVSRRLPERTYERPSAFATGRAGDVIVCHPFLVHRATWPHRGTTPRIMSQPGVMRHEPFALVGPDPLPVERAIRQALVVL